MDTAALVPAVPRAVTVRARLRHALTRYLGAFGLSAVLAIGAGGQLVSQCAPANPSPQQQVVNSVNQQRAKAGLPALAVDSRLMNAAQSHSADQARRARMSHTGSDGSSVGTRVTRAGYRWTRVTENVAAGQTTAASVVSAWMNSSAHRANILDRNVRHIGVGLAHSSNGTPYWTMVAARP